MGTKIGELNGKWAFLLKIHLSLLTIVAPFFIGWSIYITRESFASSHFRTSSEVFTQADGRDLEKRLEDRIIEAEKVQARILVILERIDNNTREPRE